MINGASCVRLRSERRNNVEAYHLSIAQICDSQPLKILTPIDEFTPECLSLRAVGRLRADDVLQCLTELFTERGVRGHFRSDNGGDFLARAVRR